MSTGGSLARLGWVSWGRSQYHIISIPSKWSLAGTIHIQCMTNIAISYYYCNSSCNYTCSSNGQYTPGLAYIRSFSITILLILLICRYIQVVQAAQVKPQPHAMVTATYIAGGACGVCQLQAVYSSSSTYRLTGPTISPCKQRTCRINRYTKS